MTTASKDTARDHIPADEGNSAGLAALGKTTPADADNDDHRGAEDSDGEVNIRYAL